MNQRTHRPLRAALHMAVAIATAAWPALGFGQVAQPALAGAYGQDPSALRVDMSGSTASTRAVTLPKGRSAIVELPVDVRDVLVTNPAVADAVVRSPRRIYVMGLSSGQTDAVFFDAAGRRLLSLDIRVSQDTRGLTADLQRLLPGSAIIAEGVNDSVVLTGQVANSEDADRAQHLAERFVSKPEQVVNMLHVAGKEQVMLKVRIVEMQRNIIKQLGFNLSALVGQAGSPQFLVGTAASFAVNGAIQGGLNSGYQLNTTTQPEANMYDPATKAFDLPIVCNGASQALACTNGGPKTIATTQTTSGSTGLNKASAMIQAFEQVGLVHTLAEPNLTAVSGESAKFLAGGEYPVPTGEDATGRITVEFKPYGVGLGFTPVVLSGGLISMHISTEVSELTNQGAFAVPSTTTAAGTVIAGLTVPALTVRRAETTVELPSGGSMMIAGLLQQETKQDLASLPGMMNLPVLGALFRSNDYLSGETELVVLVTPYLVKSVSPNDLQTPADGFKPADDLQTNLLGKLNKAYSTPPQAVQGRSYQGSYGYVIE